MESIKQTFFQECEDLLQDLESGLILMNDGEGDDETINRVFRAVHSIKGGAGAFELTDLVKFSHIFENTLDEIRADRLETTKEVLTVLLQSSDLLMDLVDAAREGEGCDQERSQKLMDTLQGFIGTSAEEEPVEEAMPDFEPQSMDDMGFEPVVMDFGLGGDEDDAQQDAGFSIHFTPTAKMYAHGNETARLLSTLAGLGEIKTVCEHGDLPGFDDLDPEGSYLSWDVELITESSEDDVRENFEFVEDDCGLTITPLGGVSLPDLADLPDLDDTVKIEVETETTTPEPTPVVTEKVDSAPKKPSKKSAADGKSAKANTGAPATIRINLERVDRLINLVGELVINQAMLTECVVDAGIANDPSVSSGLDEFKQLTRDIQESVMAIRAQPVKPLFQRMSRIVRKAASATEKSVKLVLDGEFTEVDKTIVEKLADPLTHMIRNAVDHGIESPEKRVENGKPEEGIVTLSAAHRSGKIIIEVSDDGAGVNRERVKQIAIDKNLIPEDANLTDNEIDNLLFMPGFSTVETVSTLSGRGVGMDVVKRAIHSIGGRVVISSNPEKGSTFTISLPLTLAILDGMLVTTSEQTLVVPLTSIVETLIPAPDDIHPMGSNSVINIRGTFVPLVDVGMQLGFRQEPTNTDNCVVMSITTDDGVQSALLVDSIQEQRQVVIKSLETNYGHVPCIAAATILGDGRIALILDVDHLTEQAGRNTLMTDLPQIAAE